MAILALELSAPTEAAKFDRPLIAVAESSRPTPAAVNIPMFRVMSANE